MESRILRGLITNKDYTRKVIPFLKSEYFKDSNRKVFEVINSYYNDYLELPNREELIQEINRLSGLRQNVYEDSLALIDEISNSSTNDNENWLIDRTEEFCQEKALYNAMSDAIRIMNGEDHTRDKGCVPSLLEDALAITFEPNVGHDYFENAEDRFKLFHERVDRVPFDLEYMNLITKGGLPGKSLTVITATTNAGKSLMMCHMAAANLTMGKNVLYITLEMAEERIAQRIDANLFDLPLNDVEDLPYQVFSERIQNLKDMIPGKLIVKEYPTGTANAHHFNALLNELALKKNFFPDIIYVDYINICASSRMKAANVNSYAYVKAIAEELRGIAQAKNVPLVTATQLNRQGANNSDPDLTNTADSFGLPMTADLQFVLIRNEVLDRSNVVLVKQLKNRFNDASTNTKFTLGIDRAKMKLFDVVQPDYISESNQTSDDEGPSSRDRRMGQLRERLGEVNFDD